MGTPIGDYTGHLLSSDDYVALIPTTGSEECRSDEKDAATEIMQGSYMQVSLNGDGSVEIPIVAADLPAWQERFNKQHRAVNGAQLMGEQRYTTLKAARRDGVVDDRPFSVE